MNKKVPLLCPSCSRSLKIRTMHCSACGTTVEGQFSLPPLSSLNESEQEFVLAFVKSSGSLKEMSKQLKLSYPSVRNMLDEIIQRIRELEKNNHHENA